MNKPALIALLEDLQNAKEGSRGLSNDCLFAVGFTITDKYSKGKRLCDFVTPNGHGIYKRDTQPDPTRSVDDALDCMVPEGMNWNARGYGGRIYNFRFHSEGLWEADTFPLVVCIARIKLELNKCDD